MSFGEAENRGPWTEERSALHARLSEIDSSLAGLYRCVLDTLATQAQAGEAKARAAVIGHCVRELLNNLPESLGDVENLPPRGQSSGPQLRTLATIVADLDEFPGMDELDSDPKSLITVRAAFVRAARAAAESYEAGENRSRMRDAAVVLGRLDTSDPALRPWTAARRFFMSFTHLDGRPYVPTDPDLPTDEAVLRHLSVIEAALDARLGSFFGNLAAIEDILGQANRIAPEGEQ